MTDGVQFRESISGAPKGKLTRIETSEQMQNIAETIKLRIKNYIPLTRTSIELDDDEDIGIVVKVSTRKRIKEFQEPGESYDKFLNRILDKIEQ